MIILIFLLSLYVLLYAFILAVMYMKIKRKEKIHPLWFVALLVLTILPLVVLSFSISANTVKEVVVPGT